MTMDTFGGANNPATMVFVGDGIDFGLDVFSPQRSAARSSGELTLAYMHAFKNSVTGPSFFNNSTSPLSAVNETIEMSQNSIGNAYGWKL
jgi:long-chain fatty acid transport protein